MYKIHPFILFALFALSQSTESAYTTAMPLMASSLNVLPSQIQSTSSIYFYGFASGIFFLGGLSDILGRKKVVFIGLSLFCLANIMIFFSRDIHHLMFLRFLQAFGASVGSVCAQAMARDSYKGLELSKLYASLASLLAIMPSISSFIAGHITEYYGWKGVAIYLVVVSIFLLIMCLLFLQETSDRSYKTPYPDYANVFAHMVFDRRVISSGLIIGIFNGIMCGLYIEAPFVFIENFGVKVSTYGYILLLQGLSAVLGGIFCRAIQEYVADISLIKKNGLLLSVFSCSSLFIIGFLWSNKSIASNIAMYGIIISMMMQFFSYAIIMPLILQSALAAYSKTSGTAGSIFGAYYYSLVATMNMIVTHLHGLDIVKVTLFFLCASIVANLSNYFSERYVS
ncbi:MAG: Bcr/CflA family efflux MFS transporter [Rickettsiaceae bacterium]|nr:Bcr/CflA family efflux MFS transporter [Rickettsiaceae bacterium]